MEQKIIDFIKAKTARSETALINWRRRKYG